MRHVLIDSGVWYAMFDPRDGHAREAARIGEALADLRIVVPYPTL